MKPIAFALLLILSSARAATPSDVAFYRSLKIIKGHDDKARAKAVAAIASMPAWTADEERAVAALLDYDGFFKAHRFQVREAAIELFTGHPPSTPFAWLKVTKSLTSPDPVIRDAAGRLLANQRPSDAAVAQAVGSDLDYEAGTPAVNTSVQETAAMVMKALQPTDPQALISVAHALQSLDDQVRATATALLIAEKPTDPRVIDEIRRGTQFLAFNPSVRDAIRQNAANVLKAIGR